MKQEIFKLKGKTIAIIDWANVYGWFKKLKWEINPQKLFNYLKSYSEVYDIRFYFGLEAGNKKSEEFQEEIRHIGFNIVSKNVKWVPVSLEAVHFQKFIQKLTKMSGDLKIGQLLEIPIYRRKCDFDCEITLDIMKNIDKFDGVILFSGDGDYAVVVNELIKRGKQIIVVFAKGCKGREYQDFKKGLYLCSVKTLKPFIKK